MSVPRPPRKKPTSIEEITRTLRVFDILAEEMGKRRGQPLDWDEWPPILEVSERIAARTED